MDTHAHSTGKYGRNLYTHETEKNTREPLKLITFHQSHCDVHCRLEKKVMRRYSWDCEIPQFVTDYSCNEKATRLLRAETQAL